MNRLSTKKRGSRGFTLIEVLVGITIFALGMLALAHLQGNLARNSGDSNARTVGANIAEEVIEAARIFSQIPTDPDGIADAFEDIQDDQWSITRGGVVYNLTSVVTDYYYQEDTGSFSITQPPTVIYPDMKLLELTVVWNDSQEFQIGDGQSTSGQLDSGSITLTDIISSITSGSGGKVVLNSKINSVYSPPVNYNPGENPDIISIKLGANKFKESTTPLPDVIRTDESVETRFDVVTYSQDDAGATFLRREEFRVISCECTLRAAYSAGDGGLRPTLWEGNEYTEAEYVVKPWGESANNRQSDFCSLCCRDHHDGGSGSNDQGADPGRSQYNPFRSGDDYYTSGAISGDHKHYNRDKSGNLNLADSDGNTYMEACRMIRKDGFFRVAQDLRQEGLNSFPAEYLDDTVEVAEYSGYVTDAVSTYEYDMGTTNLYEQNPPILTAAADMPTPLVFPASTSATATIMSAVGITEQQLRARGIYIDYMSDDLRSKINCLDLGGDGASCEVPNVTTALEIIPFFDVQLTWLSRWNELPINDPIDVSNEAIKDDNAHSRGFASLQSGLGVSTISSAVHKGNLGLTGTDPVDLTYADDEEIYYLHAQVDDGSGTPPALSDTVISGDITSSVSGVKASDVEIEATGAQCDRTNTGFECVLEEGAIDPRLTVSNYFKNNTTLVACSDELVIHGQEHIATNGTGNWTRFDLPPSSTSTAHIVIKQDIC